MKNDGNIAIPANLLDTLKNLQDSIFNHFYLFQQGDGGENVKTNENGVL